MKWINKLERKYGHLGISNLMLYIVAITGLVYVALYYDASGMIYYKLTMDPNAVMQGEIWRLITYIFIPPSTSPVFLAFILYFYYMIGKSLEDEWGTFKFNLYYLIGILGTTLAAFITGYSATTFYLNMSLFLAFAWIYPNYTIRIFFFIPVQVKYLALFYLLYLVVALIFNPMSEKIAAIVSLLNYFLFFGKDMYYAFKHRKFAVGNKRSFKTKTKTLKNQPLHTCTVCGITDIDDPYMDFRYCVDCNGHYGYCRDHLENHEHIV